MGWLAECQTRSSDLVYVALFCPVDHGPEGMETILSMSSAGSGPFEA